MTRFSAALCAIFILAVGTARADELACSEFKGYAEINQTIWERLTGSDPVFELGQYFRFSDGEVTAQIETLLGTFEAGSSANSSFSNGMPNRMNMILWNLLMSGLSRDIAGLCSGPNGILGGVARPEFTNRVKPLCAWPDASAKTDDVLLGFWTALMGFDAPETEYDAWKAFFLTGPYASQPARDAIAAMSLAILLNPYFLLGE